MSYFRTTSNRRPADPPRNTGGRFVAVVIALAALAVIAAVWFWTALQAVPVPLVGWQNGMMVGGGGVFCLAVLAALRTGFENLLEWLWAIVATAAAVVVAIFWGIMAVFGLD